MADTRSRGGNAVLSLVLFLSRLAMGLYLLLAGVDKIRGGVGQFYSQGFLGMKPAWLPDWFASPFGHAIPFLEVIVGAALILGFWGRLTAGAAALLILSFTIALYEAGKFYNNPGPFHNNVILVAFALLLAVTGAGGLSIDGIRRRRDRKLGLTAEPVEPSV